MAENDRVVAIENDQPIALRRKRRSCNGGEILSRSNSQASALPSIEVSIPPPATPRSKRSKKRVRFSDPGPNLLQSSSGLTPFFRKTSLSSAKSNRRHSAPVKRLLDRRQDNEPFCGELQFAPLRQVLDGRVTRRMRRNGLSEETNKVEWEKKHEAKARKSEIFRLRKELEEKDYELQCIQDEHDVASQLGFEAGTSILPNATMVEKFQEMEKEIQELKEELSQKEERSDAHHDWQTGTRDPFDFDDDDHNMSVDGDHHTLNRHDDDTGMVIDSSYDDHKMMNFNGSFSKPGDLLNTSTQHNISFPSPPATIADTSSQKPSFSSNSTQANFLDPLNAKLEAQLFDLQSEIKSVSSALALNKDHEYRLFQKLSSYISSDQSHDNSTLDSALDSVLTTLTIAQAQVLENEASFNALSTEVTSLGFSADPETTIKIIVEQFRKARLELEYLTPGEVIEGFENDKLLSMLLDRLKNLAEKARKQDETIDQYHEQEVILRQQLTARIDALHDVQKELSAVSTAVSRMTKEVTENEISNSRLQNALNGYRSEVSGLENLVERIEKEHQAVEDGLKRGIHNLDDQLQREIFRANAFAVELEGKNMIVGELSTRLTAALSASTALQNLLNEKEGQILLSDRRMSEQLTERDERIEELQEELERTTFILKNTQKAVENLRQENSDLKTENEDLENCAEKLKGEVNREKKRGKKVVEGMRRQLAGIMDIGRGYVESDCDESSETEAGELSRDLKVKAPVVRKGKYLDTGLARRKSSGGVAASGKKKKRRYDSGLGFLEEEEEADETEEQEMHGNREELDTLA
ncbi:230eff8e-7313-458e-ad23-65b4b37efc87 [Sclerotinia trifoliorum]|uniref:230eff8e-7313-458e-ad23-65b4b37efc87 n=1 Tax=Sclerotinia trifoliorum TaxID=28548 RepID=A0A8H2ZW11_9HELO|nr:230eff8e-7313-458e-ad23-65b4b37efc87 [Sclerotinia trifoliorum]